MIKQDPCQIQLRKKNNKKNKKKCKNQLEMRFNLVHVDQTY